MEELIKGTIYKFLQNKRTRDAVYLRKGTRSSVLDKLFDWQTSEDIEGHHFERFAYITPEIPGGVMFISFEHAQFIFDGKSIAETNSGHREILIPETDNRNHGHSGDFRKELLKMLNA